MNSGPEPRMRRGAVVGVAIAAVLGLVALAAFVFAFMARGGEGERPPAAASGGTLRVGVVGVDSLDPADARDPTALMVVDQLFDTLVTYDAKTLLPRPALAERFEAGPEQKVFTFHLADATFHDGTPVTAADVKFTLERIARRGSESPLAAQLEGVSGYGPFHVDGTAAGLAGVEAPDDDTVVVRLEAPFASFPTVLGHPGFGIVPKAAVDSLGDGFKAEPVGSGPFRLDSREEGRLRLEHYRDHRNAPFLEGIDFVRFADIAGAYDAFVRERVDVAPIPPNQVKEATERFGTDGVEPYIGIVFYGMNLKSPDLADSRFRQAVTLAVNQSGIIADVYRGTVEPATGLVAEGIPGRADDACRDRCDYDPARAKTLLREAFPDGEVPEVTIDHDDDPTQAAVAGAIAADLEAVGIPAALRPHALAGYASFLVSGASELFRLGWIAEYPSAGAFLEPLFRTGSPENLVGLSSPEVDAKLEAARTEADAAARQALYREAEQLVLDQFVVVPVVQLETRLVVGKRVRSFAVDLVGSFDGAAVSLAGEE